jgi:methionine aminopeptidase
MEKLNSLEQLDDYENIEKYLVGGQIVKKIINKLIKIVKIGSNLKELCILGDQMILDETKKVLKKKKFKYGRGISFPTCISLNNNAGYFITNDNILLKDGDVVKIELGVHFDGYPSIMCKTIVVTENNENIHDDKENLVKVVNKAGKEILKILKDGLSNKLIIKKLEEISSKYNYKLLTCNGKYMHGPGVITYQMSQNNIDGKTENDEDTHQLIIPRINDTFDFEMGEMELYENEVYCFDIGMSTGNGKLDLDETFCNIYRRNKDIFYNLKLKSSKETLSKFKKNNFPINVQNLINSRFKMGLNECLNNNLLESYPSMKDNEKALIARCKFTVIIRKPKRKKKSYILITDFI